MGLPLASICIFELQSMEMCQSNVANNCGVTVVTINIVARNYGENIGPALPLTAHSTRQQQEQTQRLLLDHTSQLHQISNFKFFILHLRWVP